MKLLQLIPFFLILSAALIGGEQETLINLSEITYKPGAIYITESDWQFLQNIKKTQWKILNEHCLTKSISNNHSILLDEDHFDWLNPDIPIEQFFQSSEKGKEIADVRLEDLFNTRGIFPVLYKKTGQSFLIFEHICSCDSDNYGNPKAALAECWALLCPNFSLSMLLNHPNCIETHHIVAKKSAKDNKMHIYLVKESRENAPLEERAAIYKENNWSILLQLAEGMSHVFEKNLIPISLKPTDVHISKDGQLKLAIDISNFCSDWDDSSKETLDEVAFNFGYIFEKGLLSLYESFSKGKTQNMNDFRRFLVAKKEEISKKSFYNDIYQNEHYPVLKNFVQEVLEYLKTKSS